jgi:antitoxin VapB
MNEDPDNGLRETRQSFKHAKPGDAWPGSRASLAKNSRPLRAKVFKSGNSLALRLPAALEMEAGMEMLITPDGAGGYHLRAAPVASRKFDVDAIWGIGKHLGLKPIAPEDRIFDDVKRPWDDPDWPGWGNDG